MAGEAANDIENTLDTAAGLRRAGRIEEALDAYVRAGELARTAGFDSRLAYALRHVSDIARGLGDFHTALQTAEEAVRIYESQPAVPELDLANAGRLAALAAESLGDLSGSERRWREARELYRRLNVSAGVEECDRHLARWEVG